MRSHGPFVAIAGAAALTASAVAVPVVALTAPAVAATPASVGVAARGPVALATRSSGAPASPSSVTLTARARPGRQVAASGRVGMPSGVSLTTGCTGSVTVTLRLAGHTIRTRTAAVRRSAGVCAWNAATTLPGSTAAGARVGVTARFAGNSYLLAKSSPSRVVTVQG